MPSAEQLPALLPLPLVAATPIPAASMARRTTPRANASLHGPHDAWLRHLKIAIERRCRAQVVVTWGVTAARSSPHLDHRFHPAKDDDVSPEVFVSIAFGERMRAH